MTLKCYIMRGLPGSGKSSLAKSLDPIACICSSDDFFMKDGLYEWNVKNLPEAHRICQEKFRRLVDVNWPVIVVDNTNTTAWECFPYVAYAHTAGYEIAFVEPKTPWAWDINELVKRNVHGVPAEGIKRMFNRYESCLTVERVLDSGGSFPELLKINAAEDTKAAWEASKCPSNLSSASV